MNIYSFSVLCFSFGVLLIAILCLVKRRDQIAYRFFIFSIFICGWGFLFPIWISEQHSFQTTLLIIKISYMFVAFIPVAWLHFVFEFIGKKEIFRHFYLANYSLAFLFAALCPTNLMVADIQPFMGFKYLPIGGIVHHFHIVHFFTLVPIGLSFLIGKYFQASGLEKDKLRFFLLGALIGFTAGGSIYLTYYRIPLPLYQLALMPLYPIFTGIALIRYGLFDVQEIADAFQREKMAVLGTMAASLNHEIKNPLFVVRGKAECYLDALERKKYTSVEELYEAGKSAVNPILNQVTRALDIIQKFTDFARPFTAKGSRETVILSEVFNDVRELVSSEFQRSEVKLVHNLTNGVAVVANRRHVEEILSNLVINACHAVGESGGEVSVMAKSANKKIKIEVSDTGPGISKENLARVFEPFFTTKGPKGSGLGLYITKQLVERNGGKISVKSKLGAGTSFKLEFKK